MTLPSCRFLPKLWSGRRRACLLALGLAGCAPVEADVEADALPGRYPNQLTSADATLDFALLAPSSGFGKSSRQLSAVARSAESGVEVLALEPLEARDVDGDGLEDVVASFSVAALRDAGLVGPGNVRLRVDVRAGTQTLLTGTDRVLGVDAPVVRLPVPTGPHSVGTSHHYLLDAERDRVSAEGRPLYVRLWYPAVSTPAQPASYVLVEETAQLVAASLGAPQEFFDAVHAWSVRDARPAALGPRPTLLLSTGLGVPLDAYSALGEGLASHGYLVVGVGHPDGGSGPIAYPDGSASSDDVLARLDELEAVEGEDELLTLERAILSAANFEWARDLLFVLDWLGTGEARALPRHLRSVLALADLGRVGALGHSFGGSAAIWAALLSERVRAAANLDGEVHGDPVEQGPQSRVLVLLSDEFVAFREETQLERFLAHTRDTALLAHLTGSSHNDFSDVELLIAGLPLLEAALGDAGSPLDPERAVRIQTAYLRAFFGQELLDQPSPLLSGPHPQFPEVSLELLDAALP